MADRYARGSRWRIPETDGGDQACEDEEECRCNEATAFEKAEDGTLRKMYGVSIDQNSVHGSDSVDNAQIEIKFFFK